MELNARAKHVLELARKYALEHNIKTMGSEFLILAMYETEDSLCHFLLNEYEVTKEEIIEKTNAIFILRKKEGEYNKSLESILKEAELLASDKDVSEEHLFMSILMNRNTIAASILESLGLDIDTLIEDVKEIYDFSSNSELSYIKNITKLAKNNELALFVGREDYLNKIDIIMHRRFKNNPLLIGNAGVGKSALVEGYAKRLVDSKSDMSILSLNLTSMLSGTRYRGDFEERFDKFINEIASKKNVVVFIDEVHTIMGAATTDGNLDVANMLKPFLARGDIKLIGATTIEEYHKTIENDKALLRRFQPVFINEPSIEETMNILHGIKEEYEKFHGVYIEDNVLDYLVLESNKRIIKKYRPDKCIDILDDVLSLNSIKNAKYASEEDVDKAIDGFLHKKTDFLLNYDVFEKYRWLESSSLLDNSPLLKIAFSGNRLSYNYLLQDLDNIFSIGDESLLEIDLGSYQESNSLASLIGAPPGYIGYQDEGILSKHILEYPLCIVSFKSYSKCHYSIKRFISNMLTNGYFTDQRGRRITLDRCIVIVEGLSEKKEIGFSNIASDDNIFDEIIKGSFINDSLNKKYQEALRKHSYEVSFDFDINFENKRNVDDYLFHLLKDKREGSFNIEKEQVIKNKS